jgi:hypothetical protein
MIIRRVGVWSVARMAAAINAAIGVLAGLVLAAISILSAGIASMARDSGEQMPPFFGALFGVGAIVLLPIFYGVMGLVFGALGAAIYNLVAGAVGGIEVETQ